MYEIRENYLSIVDVIEVLTEIPSARKYWNALKTKLKDEGIELSQEMGQLKMRSEDGKMRETDVADTEQLLHLIQSVRIFTAPKGIARAGLING